jgi:hypothetical protein
MVKRAYMPGNPLTNKKRPEMALFLPWYTTEDTTRYFESTKIDYHKKQHLKTFRIQPEVWHITSAVYDVWAGRIRAA